MIQAPLTEYLSSNLLMIYSVHLLFLPSHLMDAYWPVYMGKGIYPIDTFPMSY